MQANYASDMELIVRARAGDQYAFTQIYERYAPGLYRYIYGRVGEADLAEDLRSEVFLRMLEGLGRYEDRGFPLSAWLYRIARDRTIDSARRRKSRPQVPLEDWAAVCEGPEHRLARLAEHEELRELIERLTPEQRQVIQLRFVSELSIQEVAARTGRSENAVKALQHRGIQALQRMMATISA